jgi:glycosyltransferase involved in cell wall biosynthesis
MDRKRICFVMDNNPDFLGGTAVYVNNLVTPLKNKPNLKLSCVYPGKDNKTYFKNEVEYFEIKTTLPFPLNLFEYGLKVSKFFSINSFDVINSHAMAGYFMKFIEKKDNTRLINTYHGVAYYLYKSHLKEKNIIHKLGSAGFMIIGQILEGPPTKKADQVICVSNKVKNDLEKIYGKIKNKIVIRSGVDTKKFKAHNSIKSKKELALDINKKYMIYVGRGGFWTKGLDRAVKFIQEINRLDNSYNLLIIGPDNRKSNMNYINKIKNISKYIQKTDRDTIQKYYSSAEAFLCFSRYEGGAPTLTLGEAMASGCLPICSQDSNQEIIINNLNGLILEDYSQKEAIKVLKILNNRNKKNKLIKKSIKTIKEISTEKWAKKYYEVLINE